MTILYYLFIGLVIFVLLFVICGYLLSSPKYQGPISDHFDGKKFINYGGINANQVDKIFKLLVTRKPTKWVIPKGVVKPAKVVERIDNQEFRITYINHATILIQCFGVNILTDPVYAWAAGLFGIIGPIRRLQPGIKLEDLPPIDYVFISHNHYDHLDTAAIKKLEKKFQPKFITTLGNDLLLKKYVKDLQAFDWWDSFKLTDEIEMHLTPGQHFSSRGIFDRDANLWGGFVLKTPKGKIYWAGDSGYGTFFKDIGKRLGPMRFSCIPIGAYKPEWFMGPIHINPTQAVQVHQDVQSQQSMAFHWGTFNLSDEGWDEPIHDLESAMTEKGLQTSDFQAIVNGCFFHEKW